MAVTDRIMMMHRGYFVSVPYIELSGSVVASWNGRSSRLTIYACKGTPGTVPSMDQLNAPLVCVQITDMRSVHAIRGWLNSVERSIGPKWRYRDGD